MTDPNTTPLAFGLVFFSALALAAWADWRESPSWWGFAVFLVLIGIVAGLGWLAILLWGR